MSIRVCPVFLVTLFCLAVNAGADNEVSSTHVTAGLRMGDNTLEGFGDMLIPVAKRGDSLFFVNPRLSFKDEGENEANIGLVWRHLLPGKTAIVGANAYVDSRKSKHGNRFNQVGVGVEVLGKWVDIRANWYDADSTPKLASETATQEVERETQTTIHTSVSSESTASIETRYDDPYATWHSILQDYQSATTTSTTTTTNITTTTRTTTQTRNHIYRKFEAGLDGVDAEVGIKLPFSERAPEVRFFVGHYDFEGEFGREVKGNKARLEVRAGPYLTFDAEFFEDDALNGTDYFVGARLHIPLQGKDTWKNFRKSFKKNGHRNFMERQYTDMVMRDVRVQMEESDLIEDLTRFKEKVEVDENISSSRTTNTTEETTVDSGTDTILDDVTFVDGDNNDGTEDGTAENPYDTIGEGVTDAGENGVIFVHEKTSDDGSYGEIVDLLDGQTLTSRIHTKGGMSYSTTNKPRITKDIDETGLINLASGNTVNRLELSNNGCGGCHGIINNSNSSSAPTMISNNTIMASGPATYNGIYNLNNSANVIVTGNTITTGNGYGIYNKSNSASITVSSNTIETSAKDAIFIESDHASDCHNILGNTLSPGGGSDAIRINGSAGIPNISQTSEADLADANILTSGGVNIFAGTPDYGVNCP